MAGQVPTHAAAAAAAASRIAAFNKDAERKVAMDASPSLFCILVNVRDFVREDQSEAEKRYNKIVEVVNESEIVTREIKRSPDDITSETGLRQSTGFAIAESGNKLRILTCAHTLADCYTDGYHDLTRYDADSMFSFQVYCTHHEEQVTTARGISKHSRRLRHTTEARVVAVDTKLDLLALEIDVRDLCLRAGTRARPKESCENTHPVIRLAQADPRERSRVVLPGWPPQRAKAVAVGQVSCCDWPYDAVTDLNVKGYSAKLLEVHGMVAGSGFSGSPSPNGNVEFVGVYHGVFNDDGMGYSISRKDVGAFLRDSHVLDYWVHVLSNRKTTKIWLSHRIKQMRAFWLD